MKILPDEFYINAIKNIKSNNIEFGVTISDLDKIDFCEKIGVDFYKVLSQEIENTELIKKLMKTNKRVFVSTGLSDLDGIQKLVNLIKEHKDKFSLIHTTLDPNLDYVNLKAIPKNSKDEVDLNDESLSIKELRDQIKNLCYEKEYLTACSFCNGRDYSSAIIPSAIQTKKPMEFEVIED